MSKCKFTIYKSREGRKGDRLRTENAFGQTFPTSTNGYIDALHKSRKERGFLTLVCGENELQLSDCSTGRCEASAFLESPMDPDFEVAGLRGLRRSVLKPTLYVIEKKKKKRTTKRKKR